MHRSAVLFFRTTVLRRMPEQVREKVQTKISEFAVDPFGLLQLRVSDCSPHITTLDFAKHPMNDHVVVHHCEGCKVTVHESDFNPTKAKDSKILSLSCSNSQHDMFCGCTVRVPVHMGLDISAQGDADVKISGVEPSSCHASVDYGIVHLNKVKTQQAHIFASNGSVEITGAFHGNLTIKAGMEGFVRADRIQGSSIQIDTFQGPIDCKAIYGEKVQLSTRKGNIRAGNVQGDSLKIWSTEGHVEIGSVEGNLTANLGRGSLKATVTRTDGISIQSIDGSVSLGVPENLEANLLLHGSKVETGDLRIELDAPGFRGKNVVSGKMNGGSPTCEVEISSRNGAVSLRKADWMSTLNLERPAEETDRLPAREKASIAQ